MFIEAPRTSPPVGDIPIDVKGHQRGDPLKTHDLMTCWCVNPFKRLHGWWDAVPRIVRRPESSREEDAISALNRKTPVWHADGQSSGGRAFGVASLVVASILPVWVLIVLIAGGLMAVAWLPVLVVYVAPYNLVYLVLLVAAIAFGILAIRRRSGRRLGQAGLIVVALQVIAVVAFTVWALFDRVPV